MAVFVITISIKIVSRFQWQSDCRLEGWRALRNKRFQDLTATLDQSQDTGMPHSLALMERRAEGQRAECRNRPLGRHLMNAFFLFSNPLFLGIAWTTRKTDNE